MAKDDTPVAKCTVQIVDILHGVETHVKKLTFNISGQQALRKVLEALQTHRLQARKKKVK